MSSGRPFFRRASAFLAVFLSALSLPARADAPVQAGAVLVDGFSAPLEQQGWVAIGGSDINGVVVAGDGSASFEVLPADANRNNKISLALPAAAVRGTTIYASARIRADAVSRRVNPWNGPKLMFQIASGSHADTAYPQATVPDGSYDWREVGVLTSVPANAASVGSVIGLENVTGKLTVADLKITVIEGALPETPPAPAAGPVFKGHSVPALRGAMVPRTVTPESLRVLGGEWGANLIRWQLGGTDYKDTGLETPGYDAVLDAEIARFDAILPHCEKYGLRIVLDLHSLSKKLFGSAANQDRLVSTWQRLAKHYKGRDIIWAYDIVNEPSQAGWQPGALIWNDLATRVARAIREIDAEKPLIIEPELFAVPEGFETLRPVPVNNVIYSVHMYNPGHFTHSRVWNPKQTLWTYPGTIEGEHWDKAGLERALAPVIAFQKRYNVHIYVGEFGAVRWAPGARDYLSDLIDIFEAHEWDWSIHAFREWHGWSPEHTNDINDTKPSPVPTDRELLLRGWFSRNQK
jgi:endoglucanase